MMQAVGVILYLLLAPLAGALLDGVDRKISARMQGRQGPPLLQPFYDLPSCSPSRCWRSTACRSFCCSAT